jgi:hypothetical protein
MKLLAITHRGVSINILTTRQPDIIGWSDACPFGMGGYNTAGRAWRLLIEPNSPVFGESRVNNVLEYIAMTVNAIVACRDVQGQVASPCVLALGDNTSAIGWLYRSSRLSQPHHSYPLTCRPTPSPRNHQQQVLPLLAASTRVQERSRRPPLLRRTGTGQTAPHCP